MTIRHASDVKSLWRLAVAVATWALLSLTSTGMAGEPPSVVEYAEGVLVVAGVRYERDLAAPEHGLGTVIVIVQSEGDRAEFDALIARLGLRVVETFRSFPDIFVVAVPIGYETQWVAALSQQSVVKSAGMNRLLRPTQVASNPFIERTSA